MDDDSVSDKESDRLFIINIFFIKSKIIIIKNFRRVWTTEEDEAIRVLVNRLGTKSWSIIAEHIFREYAISGRSGKQCRERWHNHLGFYF